MCVLVVFKEVCFFKQGTAYEMRLSDGSSDVCASDLEIRDHIRIVIPILREEPYPPKAMIDAIIMAISTARDHPYTRIVTSDAGSELHARVPGSDQSLLTALGEMWQIGRASCRARVCQYV